jgi:hypothetical protein
MDLGAEMPSHVGRREGGTYSAVPPSFGCLMPYQFNEARRHRIPRARYKAFNWPEYDRALQRRGNLTVWVTPEALAAWQPPCTGKPRAVASAGVVEIRRR